VGSALVVTALSALAASPAGAQTKPKAKGLDIMLMQPMMAGTWNVTVSVKKNGKEVGQKKLALTAK
jgi:hypothetical protein